MAVFARERKRQWQSWECCLMLKKCLQFSAHNQASGSKLKTSVIENDCEQVKELLGGGERCKVNRLWAFSVDGCTLLIPPLSVAICHQNLTLVRCLLQYGANPNRHGHIDIEGNRQGRRRQFTTNPFLMALEDHPNYDFHFQPQLASALLEAGADINSRAGGRMKEEEEEGGSIEYDSGITPIHRCVHIVTPPHTTVFSFLISNGADLTLQDATGRTVLEKVFMAWLECPDQEFPLYVFAKELIRRGAFKHQQTDNFCSEFELLLYVVVNSNTLLQPTDKQLNTLHLLLDAGYRCSLSDVLIFEKFHIELMDQHLSQRVHGLCVNSLKHACRLCIRKSVRSLYLLDRLSHLPPSLIEYICLNA